MQRPLILEVTAAAGQSSRVLYVPYFDYPWASSTYLSNSPRSGRRWTYHCPNRSFVKAALISPSTPPTTVWPLWLSTITYAEVSTTNQRSCHVCLGEMVYDTMSAAVTGEMDWYLRWNHLTKTRCKWWRRYLYQVWFRWRLLDADRASTVFPRQLSMLDRMNSGTTPQKWLSLCEVVGSDPWEMGWQYKWWFWGLFSRLWRLPFVPRVRRKLYYLLSRNRPYFNHEKPPTILNDLPKPQVGATWSGRWLHLDCYPLRNAFVPGPPQRISKTYKQPHRCYFGANWSNKSW